MSTAHTDVGAYSMGLLEERDRLAFEDHLAGCPACAAELAELSPMAALLRGVEPVGATGGATGGEPAGPKLTELVRRRVRQSGNAGGGRSRWGRRPASC